MNERIVRIFDDHSRLQKEFLKGSLEQIAKVAASLPQEGCRIVAGDMNASEASGTIEAEIAVIRSYGGIDGDIVTAIRDLASRGVGSKTIAKQLGVARNTVRRYRRVPVPAGVQVRPQRLGRQ